MSYIKTITTKKICPACRKWTLGVLVYTDGEHIYDCHACGYNKELSKAEIKLVTKR